MSYGGKSWTLLLPESAYPERDSVPEESNGEGFTFPHPLPADDGEAASLVRATPFMDDLVVSFALDGVSALKLGTGPGTDLLALSLSATDVIGHIAERITGQDVAMASMACTARGLVR